MQKACYNRDDFLSSGPAEPHLTSGPGELLWRAALASCDGAAKGEQEEADLQEIFSFFVPACVRAEGPRRPGHGNLAL